MAEVQTVRQEPAEFIQAAAKTYLDDLTKGIGSIKSGQLDLKNIMGRQFVADPSTLTTDAEALAVADTGLGSFKPFLEAAATAEGEAAKLVGPTAYEDYMSPFQQDIIKTTLDEFDEQTKRGLRSLNARAVQSGAFGGTREGVERAIFQSQADKNRAALNAQLLGQGFTQAQNLAAQAFNQQRALAGGQLGLAQQSPALVGQQIAGLTTLGGAQEGRQQQLLSADQQLAQRQAFQDLEAAQQLGQGIVPLISGYPDTSKTMTTPSPSALQTGLSTGATLAGIYRLIKG
tara:strand:- start:40 stop:903 length:864 start_codon:yes stop_codon:yes gene_type:complete